MPPRQGVEVHGLDDFRRELRKLADDLPRELTDANFQVATLVSQDAKQRASGVSRGARKSAESLSAARTQAAAKVRMGGSRYPFAAGFEFGSIRYPQFPAWRGSGPTAGYWLYPSIRANNDRIVDMYGDLLDRITREAFPN
jgi:hypothetical protein